MKLLNAGPSERGWHQFENAARCMRLWAFNQKTDMKFPVTPPLVKGSLIHQGLAHYYIREMYLNQGPCLESLADDYYSPNDAIALLAEHEAARTANINEANLWLSSVAAIQEAMDAYIQRYKTCSWKPIAVEQELRANIPRGTDPGLVHRWRIHPLRDRFLFTQRADLIVEDAHGFKWIVDHKSCYRITSKTLRQYILSGQFLGYQVSGRRLYGKKFGGVILNRIKLSEPYGFDRIAIDPAPAAVSGFVKMLQMTENRIQQWNHLDDPMDYPPVFSDQVCYGKYGPCQAFELCRWGKE